MKGLSVLSLASAAGVTGAAGASSRTLSIQVRMNSWKRSFGGATGAGAGAGTGPGAGRPNGRSSMTNGRHRNGGKVQRKAETKKKREDLPCLLNGLAEPLGRAFRIVKAGQLVNY